jgi:hypothetical protein
MVKRDFWTNLIKEAWKRRSIVWLSGVRRAGKTFLCKSFPDAVYFDCELPKVRRQMEDVEEFLKGLKGKVAVFDEVHRLDNPSELLKVAADHYPNVKIIATGSSMLSASAKFRDTLTGRKEEIWLTPMIAEDAVAFKNTDIKHRLLRGGIPPFFMAKEMAEKEYQEWIDSVWAKDIQELFRLERRHSFLKLFELLMLQSGGIFEASNLSDKCDASRSTVQNYLNVLESTLIFNVVRPYSTNKAAEIVKAPKVYAFDTGFVCYFKGIEKPRNEELGMLWEHYVLNEISAHLQTRDVLYWRDKHGHEIDFVLTKRKEPKLIAIECKWSERDFDVKNLLAFRKHYPEATCYVVAHDTDRSYTKTLKDVKVHFVGLTGLLEKLTA